MNRRGFLGSILALGAAPAIVRADSLMRIIPVETEVLMPVTELFVSVRSAGNCLMTLDEVARSALALAHEKYKFINALNISTGTFYDEYMDSTTYQTSILISAYPERLEGDKARVLTP